MQLTATSTWEEIHNTPANAKALSSTLISYSGTSRSFKMYKHGHNEFQSRCLTAKELPLLGEKALNGTDLQQNVMTPPVESTELQP